MRFFVFAVQGANAVERHGGNCDRDDGQEFPKQQSVAVRIQPLGYRGRWVAEYGSDQRKDREYEHDRCRNDEPEE